MPQPEEHYLQKEISVKHQLGKEPVRDVSDFIERVNGYVQERGETGSVLRLPRRAGMLSHALPPEPFPPGRAGGEQVL